MALSKELIKAQEKLKELPDEAVQTLVELSLNEENNVIGERIGRVYGDLDKDIRETFGVEKKQGEKTYDYLKRVGQEKNQSLTSLQEKAAKLDDLQKEKDNLEQQIKDGKGDESLKQKLRDAEQKAENLQKKYQTEKQDWEKKTQELTGKVSQIQLGHQFEKAASKLQFRPEFEGEATEGLVEFARHKLMEKYKPDWKEGDDGKTQMVFRKSDGELLLNPENGLRPMTVKDLLEKELKPYLGEKKDGGGTKPPKDKKTVDLPDISSARTQVEADEIIMKTLLQRGLTRGSEEFSSERKKMRDEAEISKLPVR